MSQPGQNQSCSISVYRVYPCRERPWFDFYNCSTELLPDYSCMNGCTHEWPTNETMLHAACQYKRYKFYIEFRRKPPDCAS